MMIMVTGNDRADEKYKNSNSSHNNSNNIAVNADMIEVYAELS